MKPQERNATLPIRSPVREPVALHFSALPSWHARTIQLTQSCDRLVPVYETANCEVNAVRRVSRNSSGTRCPRAGRRRDPYGAAGHISPDTATKPRARPRGVACGFSGEPVNVCRVKHGKDSKRPEADGRLSGANVCFVPGSSLPTIEVCRAGHKSIRKHGALSPASARANG